MVDLESDAFSFIAESNVGFSSSNGLDGIPEFDSAGPFGINLNRLSSVESSRKMMPSSTSATPSFVLTTSTSVAADPVMPSTSRNSSSSNFLDELCGGEGGTSSSQQQNRSAQENEYLKELTELLQDTLSRPDSSLRNVDKSMLMDLVKRLKQQSKDKPENAVQHEDVSSSGSILLASHIGPMILEYLDGFFFVMNTDGFVEFVSKNVSKYLKFEQSEMVNKPIYNFVAAENHDLFSGLLPENMAWNLLGFGDNFNVVGDNSPGIKSSGVESSSSSAAKSQHRRKTHRFMCQFLTNASAECSSNDILPTYQNLQVTAICLPLPSSSSSSFGDDDDFHLSFNVMTESQPCLVCVARRLPERSSTNFEGCQFSLRCDKNGLILDMNMKENATSQLLSKDILNSAMQIKQLFHDQDASFFDKVFQNDCSIRLLTVLKLFHSATNTYVPVQAKCSKIAQSRSSPVCGSSASGLLALSPLSPDSFHNVPFVQFDFLVLRSDDSQSQPSSSNSAAASFADFLFCDSKDSGNRLKNPLEKNNQQPETLSETASLNTRNVSSNNANVIDQSSASYQPPFDDGTFFLNEDFHYFGGNNEKNANVSAGNTMANLMSDDFRQCFEIGIDPSSLEIKPKLNDQLTLKSPTTVIPATFSTPATPLDFNVNASSSVAASTQRVQTTSFDHRSVSVMSEPPAAASSFFQSSSSQMAAQTEVQENDLQRFCQMMNLPPAATHEAVQNSPFVGNQLDHGNPNESGEQLLQEGHTILKELLSQEEKQQQQQSHSNVSFCEQPFQSPVLQNFAVQQQYFTSMQSDMMIGQPPPTPSHLQEPLPPPSQTSTGGKRKSKTTTPRKNAAAIKKNSKKTANNNMAWMSNPGFSNLPGNGNQSVEVGNFVHDQSSRNTLNCVSSPLQQQQQTHILQQLLQEEETCNINNNATDAQAGAKTALGKRKASANAQGQPITPPAFFTTPSEQLVVQNQQAKSESLLIQLLERPLASHSNQTRSLPTSIANTQFDKIAKENQENPNKQPIISTLIVESLLNNSKNAKQQQQQQQQQQQFGQNSTFSSSFYQPRPSVYQTPTMSSPSFVTGQISPLNNNPYPPDFAVQNRLFPVNSSPPMMQNSQESFMEILSQGTMSRNGPQQTLPNTLHLPSEQIMAPPQSQRSHPNNGPLTNTSTSGNLVEIYDISPPNSYGQPNKLNPPSLPQTVRQRNNNSQGNPPQPKKPRQKNVTKKPTKKQLQQLEQQQQQQQAELSQQYLSSSNMNNFPVTTYQGGNAINQQQFYFDRNEPSSSGFNFPMLMNQNRFSNGQNRFTANKMQQQSIGINDNVSNYPAPDNGPFSSMRTGSTTAFQTNAACITQPPAPGYALASSSSNQNNFQNVNPISQFQQHRFITQQQPQILPNGSFASNNSQQSQMAFQNRQRIWSDSDNQFLHRQQQSNQGLSHVATLPSLTNQDLSSFDRQQQHQPIAAVSDQSKNRQRRPRAASSSEIAPMFHNSAEPPMVSRNQESQQPQQMFVAQPTQRQPQALAGHQNANEWWTMNVDLDGEPEMDDEVTQNLLKMLNES